MAGMLKAAGALLAAGVAVFAVFFCLGHTQAQTAPEQAAVQQSEGLVQADGGDDVSDGYSLLFPDLNAEAITAISIDTPESSFRFYADGNGRVSVNGRQADAEIYGTLVEQISGLPLDHSFLNGKKELTEYGYNVGSAPGVLTAITRTHVWYTEKIPMFSRWRVFPNGGFSAIIKLCIFIPHPGTYVLRRKPRKETVSR